MSGRAATPEVDQGRGQLKSLAGKEAAVAEPYHRLDGLAVDFPHALHLAVALVGVTLVDADGVDPEYLRRVLVSQVKERRVEIPSDAEAESIALNAFCVPRVSPHV